MKKIIGIFSLVAVVTIMACSDNKPAETKKEVIVVPASPVVVTREPVKKPTTIVLDKNGVKVETKKADVTLKKQ
jgi:hypothetical protein